MQIMIECEYCGSTYDYSENHICPNCAAVPNKKQIAAAKNAAKAEQSPYAMYGTPVPAAAPTGGFMRTIIKLIPLWIGIIFVCIFMPEVKEGMMNSTIKENLQVVDEPRLETHGMNEEFTYDGIFKLVIDEAYIADSNTMNALLPDDKELLVVHLLCSVSDSDKIVNNYYNIQPYITDGSYCREPVDSTALNSCPDAFAQNIFRFSYFGYKKEADGYMCFIVDKDSDNFSLCLEETHTEGYVRQLDYIHQIGLAVSEREDSI